MSLIVRASRESDLPQITAIYAHSVAHAAASFELEPPGEDEMRRRRAELLEQGFPYLAAERDGEVVGYAYAGVYRTRPAYRYSVEDSVYVSPSCQREGVGRALLAELVARCEAQGFRLMIAVIGDRASTASIELHRALGFQQVGILEPVGYKHGRWLATVLMQRTLGAGAATPPDTDDPRRRR
jgi:L-amino acid N-acyltransferase YncA